MSVWTKTSRGWVLRTSDTNEVSQNTMKINTANRTVNDREVSQGRCVKVSGTKGQRRMSMSGLSVCVSEFIEYVINQPGGVYDIRRREYLFDVMLLFMTKALNKVSGAAHRQLFQILEAMLNETLQTQLLIHRMKELLVGTMKTLTGERIQIGRVGSNSLWNRHIQTVANLSTKMDQFKIHERKDDDLAYFTDLPKECIREIVQKLTDHRDVIHLGQTCWDMYYITEESSIWEKLVQFHFNEKQIDTFIETADCLSSTSLWQNLLDKCYRKYGLRKLYADQLVICSECKTLHWMVNGHHCWVAEENTQTVAWSEPVSPDELYSMLFN